MNDIERYDFWFREINKIEKNDTRTIDYPEPKLNIIINPDVTTAFSGYVVVVPEYRNKIIN